MNILVIRFSSLGDVVLTLPVFRRLRETFPDATLTALTKESYADALRASPDVQECLTLTPGESLAAVIRRVRARRFDVVLDLHGTLRARFVCAFAKAGRVVRYSKAALARRLFVGWRMKSSELERHTLDRYLDAVRRITGPDASLLRRILVIQTAFLGDAVLTTPLLGALRERFPSIPIDVLTTPQVADVFRTHPAVAETVIFDKHGQEASWSARWALARSLRSRGYDLAVIPHRSMTSALIARIAKIPRRIGFRSSQGRWFLTDAVPFRWDTHDVERNLALLAPLGAPQARGVLWLRPEPSAVESVGARLLSAGVAPDAPLLGVNAGSAWATKRWLPEGFAAVADRAVRELGAKVLFIGGPRDRIIVDDIVRRMRETPLHWAGATTLKELIAVVARCRVFLTNDSGPMHIAVAAGVPTVALFGPTTRELGFFPYGPGHLVIEKNLDCRPCGLHGANRCPQGHFQCMKTITPEEVFRALKTQWRTVRPQ